MLRLLSISDACQFWLISSETNLLNQGHLDIIVKFFETGRGLYLFGDNHPFYSEVNVVLNRLLLTQLGSDMSLELDVFPRVLICMHEPRGSWSGELGVSGVCFLWRARETR